MPEELTPVIREEEYLAAIAGQDVTPPDPATRKEEWLDAIAGRVDGLAEDVEDLGDIVPTPEAADEGKVLTAGADGSASWQDAPSGGGGNPTILYMSNGSFYADENLTQQYSGSAGLVALATILESNNFRCVEGSVTRYPTMISIDTNPSFGYIAASFINNALDSFETYGIWLGGDT